MEWIEGKQMTHIKVVASSFCVLVVALVGAVATAAATSSPTAGTPMGPGISTSAVTPTVTQTPVPTPMVTTSSTPTPSGDGGITLSVEIPVGPLPTFTLPTVTVSDAAPATDATQDIVREKERCNELTGYCRKIEYQDPIDISMPCEDKKIELREVGEMGEEVVAMCSSRISIVAESHLAELRAIVSDDWRPAPMDGVIRRSDIAARLLSKEIGPATGDGDCEMLPTDHVCLTVGLEITNVGSDPWSFYDEDFEVLVYETLSWVGGWRNEFSKVLYVLQGGEQLTVDVARPIPIGAENMALEFTSHLPPELLLGSAENWSAGSDADSAGSHVQPKRTLVHRLECGYDFVYVDRYTGVEGVRSRLVDEVARCDPNAVTVSPDELDALDALRSRPDSEFGQLTDPVPFRMAYKDDSQIFGIVAVSRLGLGVKCGNVETPFGHECVAVELEITNLRPDDGAMPVPFTQQVKYEVPNFVIIGGSGVAYTNGVSDPEVSPYGDDSITVYPGKRLTTRIVRFVKAGERDLRLFYRNEIKRLAFNLEPSGLEPSRLLIGMAGSSISNAAAVGESVYVHGFGVRVIEPQRGWIPFKGCCADVVPEVLITYPDVDFIQGLGGEVARQRLANDDGNASEYQGETEYVRVSIEAKNVGSVESSAIFDAGRLVLVDDEHAVYVGGFLTRPQHQLRSDGPGYVSFDRLPWPSRRRSAEIYGGGAIDLEMAWLVPAEASGLTLVYVPFTHEGGGFMRLEDSSSEREVASASPQITLDNVLDAEVTSFSGPATKGSFVGFGGRMVLRVSDVRRLPSPCSNWYGSVPGGECLRVELEFVVRPTEFRRRLFDYEDMTIVIDGEVISAQLVFEKGSRVPLRPQFESFLKWAEMDGSSMFSAAIHAEVRAGWSAGVLGFHPHGDAPIAYLSLNEPDNEDSTAEHQVDQPDMPPTSGDETVVTDADPFEYMRRLIDPDMRDSFESHIAEYAVACSALDVRPYEMHRIWVSSVAKELFEVISADSPSGLPFVIGNARKLCNELFSQTSKALVLNLLRALANYNCKNAGSAASAASAGFVVHIGEVLMDQLGPDAPVSLSDFSDYSALCEWINDPAHGSFEEFVEAQGIEAMLSDDLVDVSTIKAITEQAARREIVTESSRWFRSRPPFDESRDRFYWE